MRILSECRIEALNVVRSRVLLWTMTRRELSARYAGSMAGMLWAFAQPMLTMATYILVFDVVFAMRVGDSASSHRAGVYLVAGMLPWLGFSESLGRAASSLVDAGSLLQKNALSPALFVTRSVLASWVVFAPLMGLLMVVYGGMNGPSWSFAALPALVLLQGLLALLLGFCLAILAAAMRDVLQVLGFALSVGIFISPVLFPVDMFPADWRWVLYLNPMSALVESYQAILLHGQWPEQRLWWTTAVWLLGLTVFLERLLANSREELVDWL
jgi:lipopolysaccharide transport system permease protein